MKECPFKPGDRVTLIDNPGEVMEGVDAATIARLARHGMIVEDTHYDEQPHGPEGWWTVDLEDSPYIYMATDLKLFGT